MLVLMELSLKPLQSKVIRYFCGTIGAINLDGSILGSLSHLRFLPISLSIELNGSKKSNIEGLIISRLVSKKGSLRLKSKKGSLRPMDGVISPLLNGLSKNVGVIVESIFVFFIACFIIFILFLMNEYFLFRKSTLNTQKSSPKLAISYNKRIEISRKILIFIKVSIFIYKTVT